MAFENNEALRRLLDPAALQQAEYERRSYSPVPQPAPNLQQQNQLQPLPQYRSSFKNGPQPVMTQPFQQSGSGGFFNSLKNYLFGSPAQQTSYSPYSQQQQEALNSLLSSGQQNMQNPYSGFEPLQQELMDYFNQQIVPSLTNRFTGMTNASLSSPAFAQQLGGASKGLAQSLLSHKLNYGNQNRQFGLQQAQLGLTPQYEQGYIPGQEGLIPGVINRAIPAASYGLGAGYYGGTR
jgi:hypothetical protein